jgi:hypothetical protein
LTDAERVARPVELMDLGGRVREFDAHAKVWVCMKV